MISQSRSGSTGLPQSLPFQSIISPKHHLSKASSLHHLVHRIGSGQLMTEHSLRLAFLELWGASVEHHHRTCLVTHVDRETDASTVTLILRALSSTALRIPKENRVTSHPACVQEESRAETEQNGHSLAFSTCVCIYSSPNSDTYNEGTF